MGVHLRALLAALLLALPAASHSHSDLNRKNLTVSQMSAVGSKIRKTMAAQGIPGLSIEIAVAGRPIYARGFGMRSSGKPVNVATVFPIGSVTKQFTAACVVMLAENRRLNLDDPVRRYVRNAPHGAQVTVRDLLDQTSGLADYTEQPALQAAVGKSKLNELQPAQLLAMIADKPLKFKPGTRFDYSNTNYILAGMVVRSVTGEPYSEFLQKSILKPLKLDRVQYLTTSIPRGADVARGYAVKHGRLTLLPPFTMSWARSAGALASDAHDLVVWDNAFFHGRVVKPAYVAKMSARVKSDYGYGWVDDGAAGDRIVWHNGGIPGAYAMNVYFPRTDSEVVILTNILSADTERLAKDVHAIVFRR